MLSAGAHNRKQKTTVQMTRKVIKINGYKFFSMSNLNKDFAILQLESPVKLSKEVQLIKLPKQGDRIAVGSTCYITGLVLILYLKQ
jgi:hypothetical protein